MASPFTQSLSMRNFLVVKRVPSDGSSPKDDTTRGRRNGVGGNGGGTSNNSASNGSGGRRNIVGSNGRPRRGSGGGGGSFPEFQPLDVTYNDLLKKSRQALKANDDLGPYSCHEIGSGDKPRVRFEENDIHHLHNSCPIIDEDDTFQQHGLDVTLAAKRGISLSSLPTVGDTPQTILIRKENIKDAATSDWIVETIRGDRLATIDGEGESIVLQNPESTPANRRLVQDTEGTIYAVIFRTLSGGGKNHFRICGVEKMYEQQRKSRESGLYTYAEVKNSGSIGVRFTMKVRGDSAEKYVTEFFGPSIFKWGRGRPRGILIKNEAGKECARITILGGAKAISVEARTDVRLMTCFAVIIDEMVEHRMR